MTSPPDSSSIDDPFNLNRFLQAQDDYYEQALSEISSGRKRTHWIWFIFPQFQGLTSSFTSTLYSIKSLEETRAFLAHPVLGIRIIECATVLMRVEGRSANEIFGSPDDLKVRSSATLFASISPPDSVFERLLEKFYYSERDDKTLELLDSRT